MPARFSFLPTIFGLPLSPDRTIGRHSITPARLAAGGAERHSVAPFRSTARMADCTVYYNPACSKCRALLVLLDERGIAPKLVDYLQTPPTVAELHKLVGLLGVEAAQLLRRDTPDYAALELGEREPDARDIVAALHRFPPLLQRPVIVRGDRALIARPPERALDLFRDARG